MKYSKSKDGGFIHNCIVNRRKTDKAKAIFYCDKDKTIAFLNGYAIIPIEEYAELKGGKADLTKVNNAENDLYT